MASAAAPGRSPAVEVDDLVIRYGTVTAVDGLSFTADAGAVTCVLGPNGAGKTTTLEHLGGYRPADRGRTSILGLDPARDHRRLTRQVGVMLQEGGIPTGIRPIELLRQYHGFFPDPLDPGELLARVGLSARARTPYRRLSGGEQRRLSLALALIGRPSMVILDEPTAGIDQDGRELVRSVLDELRGDGVAVLVSTHDLDEAERMADHVVIIDRGLVVALGSPSELMRSSAGDHLLFGAPPGLDVAALGTSVGAAVHEVSRGEYRVELPPTPANVAAVTSWLAATDMPLADLRAGRQRLDDVFRRLTRHEDKSPEPGSNGPGGRRRNGRRRGSR